MDIQKLIDTMNDTAMRERANYHLTLGGLIEALEKCPPEKLVFLDEGGSITNPNSYRGYYSDLAFEPTTLNSSAEVLLEEAREALATVFTGYKGGDYRMTADTPLWVAHYGSASGIAMIDTELKQGGLVIRTKEVD